MRWGSATLTAITLALAVSCSSGGGAQPSGERGAQAALRARLQQLSDGQYGPLYRSLHPSVRARFSEATFQDCYSQALAGVSISDVKVTKTYHETIAVPGVPGRTKTVAITVSYRVSQGGQSSTETDTFHEIKVAGRWTWALAEAQLRALEQHDCKGLS